MMTAYVVHTWIMSRHVDFEYGMYRVLWSCTVLTIKGATESLAKAAMHVETNV